MSLLTSIFQSPSQTTHPTCPHSHPPYPSPLLLPPQVRLLLGEIPERVEFSAPGMREPLTPYFELTCAVRSGDLATFRYGYHGGGAWWCSVVLEEGELSVRARCFVHSCCLPFALS